MQNRKMLATALKSRNDQERHDFILKTFILKQNKYAEERKYKRDIDVIREHHRFLWDDVDAASEDSWELRLARRYYDKLFKEYCIADLTRYKENKIALRWRTEPEVVAGTGQFVCGSRKCTEKNDLRSWEVNFAYREHGEQKNALVKLRLCTEHSNQLNYTSKKREIKRLKYSERQEAKIKRRQSTKIKKKHGVSGTEEVKTSDIPSNESSEKQSQCMSKDDSDEHNCEENNTNDDSEGIWKNKPEVDTEIVSRESEFERYLEELLL